MIVGGNGGIAIAISREGSHRCSGSSRGIAAAVVVATDAFVISIAADPIGSKQIVCVVNGSCSNSGLVVAIGVIVGLVSFGVGFHDGPNEIRCRPVGP